MKYSTRFIAIVALAAVAMMGCDTKKETERTAAQSEIATPANVDAPVEEADAQPAEAEAKGKFEFEETEFNFGTVNEGDVVSHTFTFTNTGEAPLVIQSATASCGCTVPNWPKDPIPVGGKGNIDVKFNTKGKPNMQNKTVTIIANTEPKTNYLKLKGMVTPQASQAAGPIRKN